MAKTPLKFRIDQNLTSPPKSQMSCLSPSATENNSRKQIFQIIKVKKDQESSSKVIQENAKKDYKSPQLSFKSDFTFSSKSENGASQEENFNMVVDTDEFYERNPRLSSEESSQNMYAENLANPCPSNPYEVNEDSFLMLNVEKNNINSDQNISSNYQNNYLNNYQNNIADINVDNDSDNMDFLECKSSCSNIFDSNNTRCTNQFTLNSGEINIDYPHINNTNLIYSPPNLDFVSGPFLYFNNLNLSPSPSSISPTNYQKSLITGMSNTQNSYYDEQVANTNTNTNTSIKESSNISINEVVFNEIFDMNKVNTNDLIQSVSQDFRSGHVNGAGNLLKVIKNQEAIQEKPMKKYNMLKEDGPKIYKYVINSLKI